MPVYIKVCLCSSFVQTRLKSLVVHSESVVLGSWILKTNSSGLLCGGNLNVIRATYNFWWNNGPHDCSQVPCSNWSTNSTNPSWMIANMTGFLFILFFSSKHYWYSSVKYAFFANTILLDSYFTIPLIICCYVTSVVDRTFSHSNRKCAEQHTSGPVVNNWRCDIVGLEGRQHRRLFAAWCAVDDIMIRPNASRMI